MRIDPENDCAVYAIAFACTERAATVRLMLEEAGCEDGATDRQISKVVWALGCTPRRFHTPVKTVRSFARLNLEGSFIVTTADHVVAVVDGYIGHRPVPLHTDLGRIEKIHKIT